MAKIPGMGSSTLRFKVTIGGAPERAVARAIAMAVRQYPRPWKDPKAWRAFIGHDVGCPCSDGVTKRPMEVCTCKSVDVTIEKLPRG